MENISGYFAYATYAHVGEFLQYDCTESSHLQCLDFNPTGIYPKVNNTVKDGIFMIYIK